MRDLVRTTLDLALVLNAIVFMPLTIKEFLRCRRARHELEAARAWLPIRPGRSGGVVIPIHPYRFDNDGRRPTA